jgi:hypothetical protein
MNGKIAPPKPIVTYTGRPYTVVLSHHEIIGAVICHVVGATVADAIETAQLHAKAMLDIDYHRRHEPSEFTPLAVFAGHHYHEEV